MIGVIGDFASKHGGKWRSLSRGSKKNLENELEGYFFEVRETSSRFGELGKTNQGKEGWFEKGFN